MSLFDTAASTVAAAGLRVCCTITLCLVLGAPTAQAQTAPRERLSFDKGWRFALGNTDLTKDFGYGTTSFDLAKDGSADGPASPRFDDRAWQSVDVPHDWAVALPFDAAGSTDHGSKAIGIHFAQNSVGWYRKRLDVTAADRGKRFVLQFDGVYRDSVVWVNGHYLGNEHSGYSSFAYDITDYLNYGADNVVVVRADATREEGWFYEGAGIYRHVWVLKTAPVHVAQDGTFVTSQIGPDQARVTARATIANDAATAATITVDETIVDAAGQTVATFVGRSFHLEAGATETVEAALPVAHPRLWSLETPTLYRLVTSVRQGGKVVDRYETAFGIRTVTFDADKGFFLNGQPVKLKGLDNHQDHAGIGVALPDAMQVYRLNRMKAMGANAYRTAHNPPAPELLDAADRMGVLILDENRQFGTSPEILDQLRRTVIRDRNHPSVFLWSVGNEEWVDEYKETGAIVTARMQAVVKALDPTRRVTLAMSSSNETGNGGAKVTDVMGFNYMVQHHIDAYHRNFPKTPSLLTEEGSTYATRGVYVDDRAHGYIAAYDAPARAGKVDLQTGWANVAERPFLAGMFEWSGFDYRGETTPFGWPSIHSQYGMMDTTGVFKDSGYYLKSQWDPAPMVHILPHWNWAGREGETIPVWVYSNADAVELFLDGQSLGRKTMPRYGHVEWPVAYRAGTLEARGFKDGKLIATEDVTTTGADYAVALTPDVVRIKSDDDVSVVSVTVTDKDGHIVPTARDDIRFTLDGPGRIIGVGNGDPASHEADQFVDTVSLVPVRGWRLKLAPDLSDADRQGQGEGWRDLSGAAVRFSDDSRPLVLLQGHVTLDAVDPARTYALFAPGLGDGLRAFLGGKDVTALMHVDGSRVRLDLDPRDLHAGDNAIVFAFARPQKAEATSRDLLPAKGQDVATLQVTTRAAPWHRKVFNGYAQVLVQSTGAGVITLHAEGAGLQPSQVAISAE